MVRQAESERDIAALLSRAAALSATAAEAAERGDIGAALRLEERAEKLRARARKAAARGPGSAAADSDGTARPRAARTDLSPSTRDIAISVLNELEVPVAPRSVADYAAARFGSMIDPRAMASLRRDEQRSWRAAGSVRAVYIVPALEGHRFLPLRGKVALSSWPLTRRLIGPWSERADHLRATRNIARQAAWLVENRPEVGRRMIPILQHYARTISAVVDDQPTDVERAATEELTLIEEADGEWRADAEDRARAVLDEAGYLWGAAPPRAVEREVG